MKKITEIKQELRKKISCQRENLTDLDYQYKSKIINQKILLHPKFRDAKVIYCYESIHREVSLHVVQKEILRQNKILALPRIDDRTMNFYVVDHLRDLQCGYYGIYEPKEYCKVAPTPDLILVPGIAFTEQGERLGYGGGFYDQFLTGVSAYTIGIAYDFQILKELPVEEHDIILSEIVTG